MALLLLEVDTATGRITGKQTSPAGIGTVAVLNQAQTFTAANTFNSSQLLVRNPADTFSYTIAGGAILAARTITLPLLTGNDVLVAEAMAQTLTNKTLDAPVFSGAYSLGGTPTFGATMAGASTFSGAITLSAAGTALTVNNNATITGTLTVDSTTTLGRTLVGNFGGTMVWNNLSDTVEILRLTNLGVLLMSAATPGTGATINLVLGGGATSPVIGAATADLVHLAGVDIATGDRRLYIQSELGSPIIIGNNAVRTGLAGTATGSFVMSGVTSGVVTLTVAAAAGTWTMQLPAAVGAAGQQLTDAAGDGITSWAAAASIREAKNILGYKVSPQVALDRILHTRVYPFTYKDGYGTGDHKTEYLGVMADEAPWAMHFNGGILNPISTFGHTVLAIQAIDQRLTPMERNIKRLEEALVGAGVPLPDLE